MNKCELCEREAELTEHHLIPRSRKKQEKENFGPTAQLCNDCHRMIHATFDEKKLGRELNTIAALSVAEELQKYLKWIRKQPACTYFGSKTGNHKR